MPPKTQPAVRHCAIQDVFHDVHHSTRIRIPAPSLRSWRQVLSSHSPHLPGPHHITSQTAAQPATHVSKAQTITLALLCSVGMMFLPNNDADQAKGREIAEAAVAAEGFEVLGWRTVPVVPEVVGRFAKATEPRISQIVVKDGSGRTGADLERALYLMRKGMERAALAEFGEERATEFYVCSLSGQVRPGPPPAPMMLQTRCCNQLGTCMTMLG